MVALAEEPIVQEGNGTWQRLQTAVRYLEKNQVDILVLSGGFYTWRQAESAAMAMSNWLRLSGWLSRLEARGINVILEEHSRDTYENIIFSLAISDAILTKDEIIVISEKWHCRRVRLILKKVGVRHFRDQSAVYKNWCGELKEIFFYLYTLLDPSCRFFPALANRRQRLKKSLG